MVMVRISYRYYSRSYELYPGYWTHNIYLTDIHYFIVYGRDEYLIE